MIVKNSLPVNYKLSDFQKFQRFVSYTKPDFQIIRKSNRYLTPSGILFTVSQLDSETIFLRKRNNFLKVAIANFVLRRRYHIASSSFFVHNMWSIGGYYHWLLESLVKLYKFYENGIDRILLLPANAKKHAFINSSLEAFDLKEIHYYPQNRLATVEDIQTISNPPDVGCHDPKLLKKLRKLLIDHQSKKYPGSSSKQKRIFISRQRARSRRVINFDELQKLLFEYSFEIVYFEDLSFWEQINLCRHAEVMIGPHGAGLSNMLFMPKKAKIIELIGYEVGPAMLFWSLATSLGLDYYYELCEQEQGQTFDEADLKVDITNLRAILKDIFN